MGLRRTCTGLLILLTAFAFNLNAQWTSGGSFGTAQLKTSGTTLTMSPTTNVPSGALIVICVGSDNASTSDGNVDNNSVSINGGIGAVARIGRHNNGNGSAGTGANVSMYSIVLLQTLLTSHTVTVTFSGTITAKAMTCWYFTKPHGSTRTFDPTAGDGATSLSNDGADPGSINLGSLANVEHIAIRATAHESDASNMSATDGTWTLMTEAGTSGSTANTNMEICAEFKIFTGTSITSDPTWSAVDHASRMVVIHEVAQAAYTKGIINF